MRQGCIQSPFLTVIDWTVRTSTEGHKHLQCTVCKQLENRDFADDLALLSHTQKQMQKNITNRNNCSHGCAYEWIRDMAYNKSMLEDPNLCKKKSASLSNHATQHYVVPPNSKLSNAVEKIVITGGLWR